jgi:23S rRNA (pseudouridine1915-N3)-methyltransferase
MGAVIADYANRINHFYSFEITDLPAIRKSASLPKDTITKMEAEMVFRSLSAEDIVILLDEKGKEYDSRSFAQWLDKLMNLRTKNVIFITGGPYGFSKELKKTAHDTLSLSKMTFTHQMIRLFFVEQFYRACTILKGMKYHND